MSSRWISISFRGFAKIPDSVDIGVRGLHQRGLAHAARAPKQRVVGGQAAGESRRVLEQRVAHPVDAAQQDDVDPVDLPDRLKRARTGVPNEGVRFGEIRRGRRRRGQTLQRIGDTGDEGGGILC